MIRARKRYNKKVLFEFEKYSLDIYKMINEDFEICCGKKALNVDIPSFILQGDEEIKKSFFYGILITDGGIRNDNSIIFHAASKRLIYNLQRLIKDV